MANWQRTLDLLDLREKHEAGALTTYQVAQEVAKRLEALPSLPDAGGGAFLNAELSSLVEAFNDMDEDVTEGEFNSLLNELYAWADAPVQGGERSGGLVSKNCWIKFAAGS